MNLYVPSDALHIISNGSPSKIGDNVEFQIALFLLSTISSCLGGTVEKKLDIK